MKTEECSRDPPTSINKNVLKIEALVHTRKAFKAFPSTRVITKSKNLQGQIEGGAQISGLYWFIFKNFLLSRLIWFCTTLSILRVRKLPNAGSWGSSFWKFETLGTHQQKDSLCCVALPGVFSWNFWKISNWARLFCSHFRFVGWSFSRKTDFIIVIILSTWQMFFSGGVEAQKWEKAGAKNVRSLARGISEFRFKSWFFLFLENFGNKSVMSLVSFAALFFGSFESVENRERLYSTYRFSSSWVFS